MRHLGSSWATWQAVLRFVLLAQSLAFVFNQRAFAIADDSRFQVELSGEPKLSSFSAEITSNLQTIKVRIGKHLIGKLVKVEVALKNALDCDLDLELQPSCNCTGLSMTRMNATRSESILIRADVKMPSSPQEFSSAIQFHDRQRDITFAMVVEADVVDVVTIEPSHIVIEESARPFSGTITIKPNVPNLKILKLESGSDRFRVLDQPQTDPSKYSVLIQPSDTENTREESFSIRIVYEHSVDLVKTNGDDPKAEVSAAPITRDLIVPVRYTDRISMGPRISTWRLSDGRYQATLYLVGVSPEKSLEQGKLSLSNGKVRIKVQAEQITVRSEKAVVFKASFDPKEIPDLEAGESWKIEIESLKYRASSSVVLETFK